MHSAIDVGDNEEFQPGDDEGEIFLRSVPFSYGQQECVTLPTKMDRALLVSEGLSKRITYYLVRLLLYL